MVWTTLFQCDLSNDTTQPYEYYGSTKFPNEVLLDKDINKAVKEKYKAMWEEICENNIKIL